MINTRNDLASYFNTLGFKVGAEIGVARGLYSLVLCQKIPALTLYCVDEWGLAGGKLEKTHSTLYYVAAKERLSKYNAKLIKKLSMDAVDDFEDQSLDFVYIDADHNFEPVYEDIREWSKKVRNGGIIAGHDYHKTFSHRQMAVTAAVDLFIKETKLSLNITSNEEEKLSWFIHV